MQRWFVSALALVAGVILGVTIATPPPTEPRPPLPGPGAHAVFFGDSWTEGYSASPLSSGFAYVTGETMGWETTVLGEKGTGFINGGDTGRTYVSRAAELAPDPTVAIVILEGSLNDAYAPTPHGSINAAVRRTVDSLRDSYPNARIVALGPSAPTLPIAPGIVDVDAQLAMTYANVGIEYISALDWVTDGNWSAVIGDLDHPSTAGHGYLAGRLVATLRDLAQAP